MLTAIFNSIVSFAAAIVPALDIPILNFRHESSDTDDNELSSPGFLLVTEILKNDLTASQREDFVNNAAWLSCEIEKDFKTIEGKELYIFDSVYLPDSAVIARSMELEREEETACLLRDTELL